MFSSSVACANDLHNATPTRCKVHHSCEIDAVSAALTSKEPLDPPMMRNVDGQELDPGLLNWLRIQRHQLHDLKRHIYFDR